MKIERHLSFKKAYRKRVAHNEKLVAQTLERIALFQKNPKHPLLKDHGLTGSKRQHRSFCITGDIRIIYYPTSQDHVIFLDIGTHNQVY